MNSKLAEKLKFSLEPVAVYFTDLKPEEALQFEEGKRGCVAAMLITSAKGKTVVFDKNTYGCPGGGVGLCFGDVFTKENTPIECRLSTGDEALATTGKAIAVSLGKGERFFASPELAGKWRASFPYVEMPNKYVVFKPLSITDETNPPDLVHIFANPDQLSALVIMSGYSRGEWLNAIAPFGAACQSIVFAYHEMKKEYPYGIIGLFDVSQRYRIPKELLSYTVPFSMYLEFDESVNKSLLVTEAWERIEGR